LVARRCQALGNITSSPFTYDTAHRTEIGRRAAEARSQGVTLAEFIAAEEKAGRPIDASYSTIYNLSVQYGLAVARENKPEPARFFLALVYFLPGFILFVVNGTARNRRCAVKRRTDYCKAKVLRSDVSNQAVFNYQQVYRRKVEVTQTLVGMTRAVYDCVCEKRAQFCRLLPRYPQVVYAIDATDLGIKSTDGPLLLRQFNRGRFPSNACRGERCREFEGRHKPLINPVKITVACPA